MTEHVAAYLAERSMLGFRVSGPDARLLRSFAGFADEQDCGTLTNDLVIRWAKDRSRISLPFTWAGRLAVVKPFAAYMSRLDPATEFPETQIFGKSRRRLTPHIYTDDEILGLMAAARALCGDQDETAHCLVKTVPEYSTVASHNLLPTEGMDRGDYGTAEHGDEERTDGGGFGALSCFDANGEGENSG
ncbi:hypothetical protein [Ensifer adhaerens]